MELKKSRPIAKAAPDVKADIGLINEQSITELTPEDVFAFSVILCDNEIDRDYEKFADACLEGLAPLFLGKSGIFNHSWDAKDQIARIYRAAVENGEGKNAAGEQKKQLRAFAYIPRNAYTAETIAKIESGILKEVSVGVAVKSSSCSICGKGMGWSCCEDGHRKGGDYEGKMCCGILDGAADAYEFSFVAVPAQRGAGVTKSHGADAQKAFDIVLELDLSEYPRELEKLKTQLAAAELSAEEHAARRQILAENQKYIKNEV